MPVDFVSPVALRRAWSASGVPGATVALFEGGDLAETLLFGTTRHANGEALDAATVFDAASLSKPLVAWWVARLALRGDLDLDRPIILAPEVVDAVPDPRLAAITPSMLLSHRSGFPNWRPRGERLRLVANPGERVIYSGEGFEYLLAWLRQVLGHACVERELDALLLHLGMRDSSFTEANDRAHRRATGHSSTNVRVASAARPIARASGSLHTSLRDYASFICASMWGSDPEAQAQRKSTVDVGVPTAVGGERTLGWGLIQTADGPLLWQHGDNPGFRHVVAVRPSAGDGVIVLTNGDKGLALTRSVAARLGLPRRYFDEKHVYLTL